MSLWLPERALPAIPFPPMVGERPLVGERPAWTNAGGNSETPAGGGGGGPSAPAGTIVGYAKWHAGGAGVTGGAGGTTVHVTNLNSSGTGSLRAALEQTGTRTIVFDVAGTINIASWCQAKGNVTIAGETAPSPGITITGWIIQWTGSGNGNVIVRNVRHRGNVPGSSEIEGSGGFAMQNSATGLALVNCSISGVRSEMVGFWRGAKWASIIDCIVGPCPPSSYPDNSRGVLFSNNAAGISGYGITEGLTVYRTVFYDTQYRNAAFGYDDSNPTTSDSPVTTGEEVNCVVYNPMTPNGYGMTAYYGARVNMVANWGRQPSGKALVDIYYSKVYSSGNHSASGGSTAGNVGSPFAVPAVAQVSGYIASGAAVPASVLATAGCRVGGLDAFDQNIVSTITAGL